MPTKTKNVDAVDKLQQLVMDTQQKRLEIYEDIMRQHDIHVPK